MNDIVLGIDVGNTHTKIGVIRGLNVLDVFHLRTERDRPVDEYYFYLKNVCKEIGMDFIPPIWVASVVPSALIALEHLAKVRNIEYHCINPSKQFSFTIDEKIKSQIGADLLILAEAVMAKAGENAILISAGTATVVFALKNGVLLGGAIAPGIKGSVESLIQKAALLDPIFLDLPEKAVGQTTEDAMKSGIIYGFAGLIDSLVLKLKEELEFDTVPVIATGGMIGKVAKVSKTIDEVKAHLSLQGIAYIVQRQK